MLTPEAVFQLWSEILEYQRKNRIGVFALENSEEFKRYLELEYERVFGEDKKSED